MELTKIENDVVADVVEEASKTAAIELQSLQLTLVGSGVGEVILG